MSLKKVLLRNLHSQDVVRPLGTGCSEHTDRHLVGVALGWCRARRSRNVGESLLGAAGVENLKQKETITELPFSIDQTKHQFIFPFSGAKF